MLEQNDLLAAPSQARAAACNQIIQRQQLSLLLTNSQLNSHAILLLYTRNQKNPLPTWCLISQLAGQLPTPTQIPRLYNPIITNMSQQPLSRLPQRNKGSHLDKFQKVPLTSNLFRVNFKPDAQVYIYALRTLPEIPRENIKKLKLMLMSHRNTIQSLTGAYVISGRTLFGIKRQELTRGDEINLRVEFESTYYQIFLKVVREVKMADIYSPEKEKSAVVHSFLNNMVRNFFHLLEYTEIGRSKKYFDPHSKHYLQGARVSLFSGYASNFVLLENGLFLKMDTAVKIVRSESVLDTINQIYKQNSSLTKAEKRALVEEELLNKTVMANYGKGRYYVIESVLFDVCLESYKFNDNKRDRNLLEYYSETYNLNINAKRQPLLKAANDSRKSKENQTDIILVPELLLMSGLPDNFDERKRREISDNTIVTPSSKLKDIESVFRQFGSLSPDAFSPSLIEEKLNIEIEKTPTTITGKQLWFPELQLGGREKIDENRSTSFMLFNKALYSPDVSLKIAVMFPTDFDMNQVRTLFVSTCSNLGLQQKLISYPISFNDSKQALKNIESAITKECENGSANMFWFIIPPSFKTYYKDLKQFTLKAGVGRNSQIAVTSTLQKKGTASILTKILLQMAAKVGNKLWVPKVPSRLHNCGVLLIGIESYNDKSNKSTKVVSYCSNTNKQFSAFYSNYLYEPKNDSSKTNMKQIIFECLNEYIVQCQHSPTDVIILKNGSTKFDLSLAVQAEVTDIKEILKSVSKSYDPIRLVYTMVDKNSSQKFFMERGSEVVNPASGMLVNSEAVGKGFEFYLIAQHCNKGTVKPTYYRVVYSDSTLEEGIIEELLYTQCFNYMNWSGSIKVPSILQYAKKLGEFAGQYLNHDMEGGEMAKYLYYI